MEREDSQTDPRVASQTDRHPRQTESRQTDRADRDRQRFPARGRTAPAASDGRPGWLVFVNDKEGRVWIGRVVRPSAPRAARSAASELQRGLVDPVRDSPGSTGK